MSEVMCIVRLNVSLLWSTQKFQARHPQTVIGSSFHQGVGGSRDGVSGEVRCRARPPCEVSRWWIKTILILVLMRGGPGRGF